MFQSLISPQVRRTIFRACLAPLVALPALIVPSVAGAFDADHDNIPDESDAFPCSAQATAAIFAPAQGEHGMMLFEDQWPNTSDLDFNDVAITYNYIFTVNNAGQVVSMKATYNALALGGVFDNGMGLHIGVPSNTVASVTKSIGSQAPVTLTPSAMDGELTIPISDNLRELYSNHAGPINSQGEFPPMSGSTLVLEVKFKTPVSIDTGAAPFDLYIFRTQTRSLEIHRPEFRGTSAMNAALFNTGIDASSGSRHFVDSRGLPFALNLPVVSEWPREGLAIDQLFPDIINFGRTGGTSNRDFYSTHVQYQNRYIPGNSLPRPVPAFIGADHVPADTACVTAWGLAVDFGSSRNLYAYGSTVDAAGAAHITGYVRGALPGSTSSGGLDVMVGKYSDQTGAEQWSHQFGGSGDETGRDVAVDGAGNIYVVGETTSSFGGQVNGGSSDAFIMKLGPTGTVLWTRFIGGNGADTAYGVAIDPSGNVFVGGGSTSSNLTGATYPGNSPSSFLAKFDSNGNLAWNQQYLTDNTDPSNYNYTLDIAVDPVSGDVVAVGAERRYSQDGSAAENQFAIKHSGADGHVLWTNHIGDYGYTRGSADQRYAFARGVAVAPAGDIYITGEWYGGSSNGTWNDWSRAAADTSADITMTRLDSAGALSWNYSLGSSVGANDYGESVVADRNSYPARVFFTGRTGGALPGQTSRGGDDYYLAAYGADGQRLWLTQGGTAAMDQTHVASAFSTGNTVDLIGNTTGALGGSDAGLWEVAIMHHNFTSGVAGTSVVASKTGWTVSSWGACSAACGTSSQGRTVQCTRADGTVVPDSYCVETKPAVTQSCTNYATCTYSWSSGNWGTCTAACGSSTQSRTVSCVRSDSTVVADSFCTQTKPVTSQSCTDYSTCTYSWYSGTWSTCSGLCDSGSQTRSVYCRRSNGDSVADASCSGTKPTTSQTCALTACTYAWTAGNWDSCTVSCGGGVQHRAVSCQRTNDNSTVPNSSCSGSAPASSQSCNTQSCGPTSGTAWTFNYTGAVQAFTAPATGVYRLEMWGAQGSGGYGTECGRSDNSASQGARGGYAWGEVSLTAGETVWVYVGQRPLGNQTAPTCQAVEPGGWNGGGNGNCSNTCNGGGGGGGATDVRRGGQALQNRIIVAGGGGGGGNSPASTSEGGGGGGYYGIGGLSSGVPGGSGAGQGGTPSSGGGGPCVGSYGQGANSSPYQVSGGSCTGGGAGGGGYYGGGAGAYWGGGGGSSYVGSLANAGTTATVRNGHGLATITWLHN